MSYIQTMNADSLLKHKRRIRNETNDEIRSLRISIKRAEESIEIFESREKRDTTLISGLYVKIENHKLSIEKAKIHIEQLDNGELDQEIEDEIMQRSKAQLEEQADKVRAKKEKRSREKASKQAANDRWRKDKFLSKNLNREMDRAERRFHTISATLPEWLVNSLERMPNNRGHIWKGIHCYGSKPAQSRTCYLQERIDGKQMIHEITPLFDEDVEMRGPGKYETKLYDKPKFVKREYNYFDACKVLDIKPGSNIGFVSKEFRKIKHPTAGQQKAFDFIKENEKQRRSRPREDNRSRESSNKKPDRKKKPRKPNGDKRTHKKKQSVKQH